jgi:V-type H+-transporting ATPase subunit D
MGDAQVAPTRMAQQVYKGKKVAATKGYELLKKKADALKVRFRDIAKAIHAEKSLMSESCSAAFFSLTSAQYAAGEFKHKVRTSERMNERNGTKGNSQPLRRRSAHERKAHQPGGDR